MSKKVIFLSSIIVLGSIWTGLSWYSGKEIESKAPAELNNIISTFNQEIQDSIPSLYMSLNATIEDYQRGIFSSKAKIAIYENQASTPSAILISDIKHGPLPFSDIIRLHLKPKFAVINTQLAKTEETNALFDALNLTSENDSPFYITSTVYSSAIDNAIKFSNIEYYGITLLNANLNFLFEVKNNKFHLKSQKMSFDTLDILNLKLKGLNVYTNYDNSELLLGNTKLTIDESLLSDKQYNISLKKLDVLNESKPTGKETFTNISKLKVNDITINDNAIGKLDLNIIMDDLNSSAANELLSNFSKGIKEEITSDLIKVFIKNGSTIRVQPLTLSSNIGNINFASTIIFNKVDDVDTLNDIAFENMYNSIENNTSISIPMLKHIMKTLFPWHYSDQKLEAEIEPLTSGKYSPFIKKDNKLESTAVYKDGTLTLNGVSIPLPHTHTFEELE